MPIDPATVAATRSALTAELPVLIPPTEPTIFTLDASPRHPPLRPISSLTYSQCNRELRDGARDKMVEMRNQMEMGYTYNTLLDLFTISDRAKTLAAQKHPAPFAAAYSMGPPIDVPSDLAAYTGGTCFALAPLLQRRIEDMGFKAYVVGCYAGMNVLTKWPGLTSEVAEENEEALKRLGQINHADVIVPIRVSKKSPMRLLHIQCGLGPSEHHWQTLQMPCDKAKIDAFGLLPDPATLRWLGINGCLTHYVADPTGKASFGIDFLAGDLFVSHYTAKTLTFSMKNRSFHFADLLRDEEFAELEGDAAQQEVAAGWEKARHYLATIARGFSQPPHFVDNVIYLMRHRKEVMSQLMLASARRLSACETERNEAMAARQPIETILLLWQLEPASDALSDARAALRDAAKLFHEDRAFSAALAYKKAETAYINAVEEIAPQIESYSYCNATTLQPLPRDQLGQLPKGLYQAVGRGLLRADATHQAYHRVTNGLKAAGRAAIELEFGVTRDR